MAEELYHLVDTNRDHIGAFLPWVDVMLNSQMEIAFIKRMQLEKAQGIGELYFISYQGKLVGAADFHAINFAAKKGEIGYWLIKECANQGIMTQVVNFLITYGFETLGFNKITLQADTENIASNRIAQKCGFTLIGTAHQEFVLRGELRDMNMYELITK